MGNFMLLKYFQKTIDFADESKEDKRMKEKETVESMKAHLPNSPERNAQIQELAIGCAAVMIVFVVAVHLIVNVFIIPLIEKAFNML
jgi:hypothetical protein